MLTSSRLLRSGAVLAALAVLVIGSRAAASPSVEGPRCRVTLSKLSYDDPGTDDAELIELRVDRTPLDGGDAAAPAGAADASGSAGEGPLTLSACGLAAIELVDGQGGACTPYRSIPLADVAVPADDVVVLCSAETAFAASCDVTAAGRSALKNSWLQNGPNDGVRLRAVSGAAVEIGYEPPPACFSSAVLRLPDESGEVAREGSVVDDVSALCDGKFVLLAATDAALREPAVCPRPRTPVDSADASADARGAPSASPSSRAGPPSSPSPVAPDGSREPDAGYVPERAPTPRESPSKDDPLFRKDGGATKAPDLRGVPRPPGCATRPPGGQSAEGAPASALLLMLALRRVLRRRRPRPGCSPGPLRAGSSARCGLSPPRSPSR
jgi:hypothetical protein